MSNHALLSASSSHRWLNCPPSARLCESYEDKGSDFAAEGTDAHSLCEYKLRKVLGEESSDPTENLSWYNAEMEDCASGYASFVIELVTEAKKTCNDPVVLIEQCLDYSGYVKEGFGTGDCLIISDGTLHIVDFKYGRGVLIEAEDNPQMKLYAGKSSDASSLCLNDQGGNHMDITAGVTSTLRAEAHHPPLVFENHSQDSRYVGPLDKSQTVLATFGTGANNQPFVVETAECFDVRFTSEGTRNARANVYPTHTARTIDTSGNTPDSNQGGIAVVEGNGSRPSHMGDGYKESDVMYTLNATEQHGVAYGIDRATYNMGQNAKYDISVREEVEPTMVAKGPGAVAHPVYSTSKNSYHVEAEENLANTLVATDYKDPPTVTEEPYYIVRRLTPVECARLQGFPDWWCADLETENPTEDDIAFWKEVFETHRKIMGISSKPKTDAQIVKWLKNPHSDSAEYKLWGNGVALPNVCFVLSGIVYYSQNEAAI